MTVSRILLWLASAFFVWACLIPAGLPGEPWLVPGGLAAWMLALITG